jgi:hypothetical protein
VSGSHLLQNQPYLYPVIADRSTPTLDFACGNFLGSNYPMFHSLLPVFLAQPSLIADSSCSPLFFAWLSVTLSQKKKLQRTMIFSLSPCLEVDLFALTGVGLLC